MRDINKVGREYGVPKNNKNRASVYSEKKWVYKSISKRVHPENSDLFKCSCCGEYKPRDSYYAAKRELCGITFMCKDCTREKSRLKKIKYKEDHKEEIEQKAAARKIARETRWLNNKEKRKAYSKAYSKEYYKKHPEKRKEELVKQLKRDKEKYKNNPKFRLNVRIRNSIGKHLRGEKCGRHWEDLVGWTINDLQKHITKQLRDKMTWENYGSYWHIDHIVPVAVHNFKTEKDIDFKKCWSLKNLQPLEAKENLSKNDKLERAFQPSMAFY